MSTVQSIEFAIEYYHHTLPQSANLIPFPTFENLVTRVKRLVSLADHGYTDLKEAKVMLNAFKFLDCQIKRNSLHYTIVDFTEETEYYTSFHHKMVHYRLDTDSLSRLNQAMTQFLNIAHIFHEQSSFMFCNHEQKYADNTHDHLIQKIKLQFHYEIPEANSLVVVIDTSHNANVPFDSTYCYNVYINQSAAKKWKSIGIPIGPKRMTQLAIKLQILAKETLESGEIMIHRLHREISTNLLNRILGFIKMGRPFFNFHCADFVRLMDLEYKTKTYSKFTCEQNLKPGDILCLTAKPICDSDVNLTKFVDENFIHFAVYIGKTIYLSLFGAQGPIRAASLSALQMSYNDYQDMVVIQ